MAIGRALNVRERITEFCYLHQATGTDRRLEDDTLSRCEWDQLERIYTLLEDFYAITLTARLAQRDRFPTQLIQEGARSRRP